MSIEALEIMNQHRKDCTENGVSSEEFLINGATSFYGTFDKSHIEEKTDSANVDQKNLSPKIMVNDMPSGLVGGTSVIKRVFTGEEYIFSFYGEDTEGIGQIWLY